MDIALASAAAGAKAGQRGRHGPSRLAPRWSSGRTTRRIVSLLVTCARIDYSGAPVQQQAATLFAPKATVVTHKLSVTVQIDLDGQSLRILAAGCLTAASQRALHPLIRRARTLTPGIHVSVDCTGAHHVEPAGVELLRAATDHDEAAEMLRPVEFLFPDPLPDSFGDLRSPRYHQVVSAHAAS
jgi:hypothetical protein